MNKNYKVFSDKEMSKIMKYKYDSASYEPLTHISDSTEWVGYSDIPNDYGIKLEDLGNLVAHIPDDVVYGIFKPERIIFNPPATICCFPDGEKIVVKCTDGDAFIEEVGVMACIVKKIFASRSEFEKLVKSGYRQPDLKK